MFIPVIKITERNKFTICLKTPLFSSWSCNFYRIWCCFCSGCVRAPVESLYTVQIHVSARVSWGQMLLLWFKYVFTSGPCLLSHQSEDLRISTKHHLSNIITCRLCSFTQYFKPHPTLFPMQVWVSIFLRFSHFTFITKAVGVTWHISLGDFSICLVACTLVIK